jgi:membrane protease YdiL (CAAX protease family)
MSVQVVWLPARGIAALVHFGRELPGARLLLVGVGLGLASALFSTLVLGDSLAWLRAVVNYVLLVAYAVVIHVATDPPPDAPRPGLRHVELLLWLVLAIWVAAQTFGVRFPWIEARLDDWVLDPVRTWSGLTPDRADAAGRAFWRVLYVLLVPWVAFSLLGQRPTDLGLRPRKIALGLLLVGAGVALHLFGRAALPRPEAPESLRTAATAFFFTLFTRALPLELFYRGVLLPRLETHLPSRLDALALAALLYTLGQVPERTLAGTPPWTLVLDVVSGLGAAPALAWGYLYLRTRSVWPGAIWHAAHVTFDAVFW